MINLSIGRDNDLARERWVKESLNKIPAGLKILDAGAGQKRYKQACAHLEYISQDFAKYDGEGDGAGFQQGTWDQTGLDIVSDIISIPVPDSSFDAVMCVEVFEHLPNPILAIKEFSRILKPGGYLIITAPFASGVHFAPYYYCTGFSKYFYDYHLPLNNFKISEFTTNGSYFSYLAQELRRLPLMAKKYSGVRLTLIYQLLFAPLLFILDSLNKKDKGSREFMSFGSQVLARKI